MALQMRLSQTDSRVYSPDRDLAYCTPHLVMRAISGLDPERQEPWIKQYIADNEIAEDDLIAAARVTADYMNTAITDPTHKTPLDALNAVGFDKLPGKVQYLLCAKLGQVFLSASFCAIRDVTKNPAEPPYDAASITAVAIGLADKHREKNKHWMTRLMSWRWYK